MPNIHTLVSEKPPYFIHLFKAADYQTLEIQLRRYSHIHIDIQRVVVRHKGARVCTAGYGIEHRRFHFYISESVEILADTADDFRAYDKRPLDLGIGNEVDVSLSVTRVRIFQSVELFGQRSERL